MNGYPKDAGGERVGAGDGARNKAEDEPLRAQLPSIQLQSGLALAGIDLFVRRKKKSAEAL